MYTAISKLHRERGDLKAAAQDLATSTKLGEQIELPDWQYRWCIAQARLEESRGNLDGALDLLNKAKRLYVRTPLPQVRPIAALKARVWVKQTKLTRALGWARERSLSVDDDLCYLREFEHVTLARVLIARGDNSIHEAEGLLERLLKAAEQGGRMGSVIEILALQALAHHAQGDIPRALDSLERALTLGEPEGYARIFVDEGLPMAHLLSEASAQGIMPDYIARLLAIFQAQEQKSKDKSHLSHAPLGLGVQPLIEPLTPREREVLQHLVAGRSNPEIAAQLVIAVTTVKTHVKNIYGKLKVSKRFQAIARAKDLNLL